MEQDRRTFLGQAGKLLVLTASAAAAWEHVVAGTPEAAPDYAATRHWWGMAIDIEKCIGCGACVRACKTENDVPHEPFTFRTWVERYVVDPADYEHPTVESPNGGYGGFHEREVRDPSLKMFYVPKLCNHCEHPPCVQVCPVGATFQSPEGVVLVDDQRCIGCRYCIQACPYGARYLHPATMTADKCTFCYHRLAKDLLPACVEVCPTQARVFGDLESTASPLTRLIRMNKIHVLKDHLNTEPKVFYANLDGEVR